MKHQKLKLSIPKPCHENWDKMSAAEKGRFCDVCSKTVMDFTQMKTNEIITYISKSNETVCGRVNTRTLMIPEEGAKRNYFKQAFSFLFFSVFLMLFNSCYRAMGMIEVKSSDKDSLTDSLSSAGMNDSLLHSNSAPKAVKDSIKKVKINGHKVGEVKIEPKILGKIILEDPNLNRDSL
ncbi:MAG TPA: hypothetical protein VGF79_03640 [Bacteroidia bacterium]